jgi:heat shock protein HtpX
MKIAKRIIVFTLVNILVVLSISALISILGVQPYMDAKGLNYSTLAVYCLLWGGGGALVSLAFSRIMAKWMMGVKVIDPHRASPEELEIVARVHRLARKAGISTMPEVGIYESGELNAFATGPTRNRALVAVSRGLLLEMNRSELEGVLAHEVAHISNGDMVTMTLVQGVVNAFVMFFARVVAWFAACSGCSGSPAGWPTTCR